MRAVVEDSGDLLFEDEYKSAAWFGIIYLVTTFAILVFLHGVKEIPLYVFFIFFFFIGVCALLVRLNLRSNCRFIVHEKKFVFEVVSSDIVTSGTVPIQDIKKIVEEETRDDDGETGKRFAIEYGSITIPLYLAWKSKTEQEELRQLINNWLIQNSFASLAIHENA